MAQLRYREETRRQQWRFRKDPAAFLAALEAQLLGKVFRSGEKKEHRVPQLAIRSIRVV